jgi:hypothetical protein
MNKSCTRRKGNEEFSLPIISKEQKMKKWKLIIVSILVTSLILGACAKATETMEAEQPEEPEVVAPEPEEAEIPAEPVTITLWAEMVRRN